MSILSSYMKKAETELKQFLFLCGNKDRILLLSENDKYEIDEYIRLACISLVFGYRTVFLKIAAIVENYTDVFLKGFDKLKGNFLLLNKWVNEFINNMEYPEAQALALQVWQERKEKLDRKDFTVKLMFDTM